MSGTIRDNASELHLVKPTCSGAGAALRSARSELHVLCTP